MGKTPIAEAQPYKTQLDEFLSRKYIDQSLLLGFNSVVQSKFEAWIINDFHKYFNSIESEKIIGTESSDTQNITAEFTTINYLETIWSDFHYPVIKFFSYEHSVHFQEINRSFKNDKSHFRVKPVEIRKISENFLKFAKQVYQFYQTLLKHFISQFKNPVLPKSVIEHFKLSISADAYTASEANVQANLLYLIHKCILALGDLSRHRSLIEVSYLNPCISNREFFKYKSLAEKEKTIFLKPFFENALKYYQLCILILPALNEPYNHTGMIYNLIDDKYSSCLWFLRSQFTRIPDYQLGLNNLNRIMEKKWFLGVFDEQSKCAKFEYSELEKLNFTFICLIGYFYMPSVYKQGPNLGRKHPFSKVEGQLFKTLTNSIDKIFKSDDDYILKQLTILVCFYKLLETQGPAPSQRAFLDKEDTLNKYSNFSFRYVETILRGLMTVDLNVLKSRQSLVIIRFILNWISENKVIQRTFRSKKSVVASTLGLLNRILEASDVEGSQYLDKNWFRNTNDRPLRSYYFKEDVLYRDFQLIKYQFKDFNDDHLFKASNFNLLVGDFSSYIDQDTKIPKFLDNDVVARIKEHAGDFETFLNQEIEHYENRLRIQAVLGVGNKLLHSNFNEESKRFDVKTTIEQDSNVEIDDSQAKIVPGKKWKKKEKKEKTRVLYSDIAEGPSKPSKSPSQEIEVENTVISPESSSVKVLSSIEEIESSIMNHTNQLKIEMKNDDAKDGVPPQTWAPNIPFSGPLSQPNNQPNQPMQQPNSQPIQQPNSQPIQQPNSQPMHQSAPGLPQNLQPPLQQMFMQQPVPMHQYYPQYMPYGAPNFDAGSTPYNYMMQPPYPTQGYGQPMTQYPQYGYSPRPDGYYGS